MKSKNDIQIFPEIKRILWHYIKFILVFELLWLLLETIGNGIQNIREWYVDGITYLVIPILFLLMIVNREQKYNTLTITSSGISGSRGFLKSEKVFIAFNKIDRSNTKKQNIIQKYLCYYVIYSESNDQIAITLEYYSKEQQNILVDRLNISL
jgi:hypothetical protein